MRALNPAFDENFLMTCLKLASVLAIHDVVGGTCNRPGAARRLERRKIIDSLREEVQLSMRTRKASFAGCRKRTHPRTDLPLPIFLVTQHSAAPQRWRRFART